MRNMNVFWERKRRVRACLGVCMCLRACVRACMYVCVVQGTGAILIFQIAMCIRTNLMMNENNIYTREKARWRLLKFIVLFGLLSLTAAGYANNIYIWLMAVWHFIFADQFYFTVVLKLYAICFSIYFPLRSNCAYKRRRFSYIKLTRPRCSKSIIQNWYTETDVKSA